MDQKKRRPPFLCSTSIHTTILYTGVEYTGVLRRTPEYSDYCTVEANNPHTVNKNSLKSYGPSCSLY
jgi:hypothetical protein